MITVLNRFEGQEIHTTSPRMTLCDELHDITVKYEALEQKYNRIRLENTQYKHHIADIMHQNEELQQEVQRYQENEILDIDPMLSEHISSIHTSLSQKNEAMKELTDKLHESFQLIKSLKSEIITINQQNEKCRIALENNNKQKQILKQIHNDSISVKNNEIRSFQNEMQLLREELHRVKSVKCHDLKAKSSNNLSPDILPDVLPRIGWSKTMEESPYQHIVSMAATVSTESVEFISHKRCITIEEMEQFEYEQRLEVLEMENAELIQKLKVLEDTKQFDDIKGKYDDDEKEKNEEDEIETNVMDEFDDDDIDEMEQLFQKCKERDYYENTDGLTRKSGNGLIKKCVNWLFWYNYQCQFVNVAK